MAVSAHIVLRVYGIFDEVWEFYEKSDIKLKEVDQEHTLLLDKPYQNYDVYVTWSVDNDVNRGFNF